LRDTRVRWADSVELKIRGDSAFIDDVAGLYIDVAIKVNPRANILGDVDCTGDIAGDVDIHVRLGTSVLIDDQMPRERGKQIRNRVLSCSSGGGVNRDSGIAGNLARRHLGSRKSRGQ